MSNEDYNNRIYQIMTNTSFTPEFISGIAGDRLQDKEEKKLFEKLIEESGDDFYVKLLFFITHETFKKEKAVQLWNEILKHKLELSKILNRNVEITVATLDYLTNIKNEISNPQLIGSAFFGRVAEMSSIDPLTKLYNRQHLSQVLEYEFKRYKRYDIAFSIVLIDVDNFKYVNDTFGHQEGDRVLKKIAYEIRIDERELDVAVRYGGDEFIIVLPHTNISMAHQTSERIRIKIEKLKHELHNVTLSIGASSCPWDSTTIEGLIGAADQAVYASKENGRNRTTSSQK